MVSAICSDNRSHWTRSQTSGFCLVQSAFTPESHDPAAVNLPIRSDDNVTPTWTCYMSGGMATLARKKPLTLFNVLRVMKDGTQGR